MWGRTWLRGLCGVALVAGAGAPHAAGAFTLMGATPETAARWAVDYGLQDGIQVAIDPSIAAAIGATSPQREALALAAIEAGVRAWESPALHFDIVFDSGVTVDPLSGFELDLMALGGSHPVWGGQSLFGLAAWSGPSGVDRTLTNGMRLNGDVISGADVYLNETLLLSLASFFPDDSVWPAALTRLVMHEVGHTLGLLHPDALANWDTDTDPDNAMSIDPSDPFAGLGLSPYTRADAIMTTRPCGAELINCPPLYYTALTSDEVGGRAVLYPVPEPAAGVLLAAAAALTRRRRRARTARSEAAPRAPRAGR